MSTGSLRVQRHHVTCRSYGTTQVSLSDAFTVGFAERLGAALDGIGGPEGYWLLRRLDVRAAIGGAWAPGQVATSVAQILAASLVQTIERGPHPGELMWFPNRGALLSRFVLDVADGRGAGRWEYAQFAEVLGRPHALLTELAHAEPDHVLVALLDLDPSELERVVGQVAPGLVADLLRTLAPGFGEGQPSLVLPATRELLRAGRLMAGRQAALLIAVTAARQHELADIAGPALDVAGLLDLMRGVGPRSHGVIAALAAGHWPEVIDVTGSPDSLLPFVQWAEADRRELCRMLVPETEPTLSEVQWTPFGGLFLLLPLLDELQGWPRDLPPCDGVAADRIVRLLVLTAALGRGRTTAPVTDPLLRLALGVPAGLSAEAVESWLASLAPASSGEDSPECCRLAPPWSSHDGAVVFHRLAASLMTELGRQLPGMSAASAEYLWENLLDLDATATITAESVVVELGDPPLCVLLSMAGMNRGRFPCEDGDRSWTLIPR